MARFSPSVSRWSRVFAAILFAFAAAFFAACEDTDDSGRISDDELNGRSPTDTAANPLSPASATNTATRSDTDPSGSGSSSGESQSGSRNTSSEIEAIVWKGKNVSGWPVTATLRASVSGDTVRLNYDKARVWPEVGGVCANCWAIANIGGRWYAGTFEYLRSGQTSKPAYTLDGSHGDHFKVSPLSFWRPQHGEVFGLMVSGLCRGGLSNVQERSNIVMVRWP